MLKNVTTRILVIAGLIMFSLALVGTSALAANNNNNGQGECKPGWGWGDKNHCHDGPPGGPSVHPVKGTQ